MKEYNTDLIGGLIVVITSFLFWKAVGNFTRFGKLFPQGIIAILFIAGIGLLIKSKINPSKRVMFMEDDKARMMAIAVISLLWVLLLDKIGFAVTSFVAMGLSFWVLKEKRGVSSLLTSFLLAGVEVTTFYLIFSNLLKIPLPTGMFF
ncbi:tripartite tricarboxylate transporter TctB family protein [Selenihalanaerobacter shriftii]|uniref:Tripartite tricarboxylate transporter TctB family protein n=1 Tax=Selenihalanaerobacter shriftii TaxID=142842 RepID=A0A1T4K257_9FIRM|nr:tripartite tricarboxylate transporter TctB family protein [Selenihalanaerobacter shriftii]SJZ36357.1 Tripartite tricarboxylate transporter TctB family protein [Selenihalanaerobacter shriftii]